MCECCRKSNNMAEKGASSTEMYPGGQVAFKMLSEFKHVKLFFYIK